MTDPSYPKPALPVTGQGAGIDPPPDSIRKKTIRGTFYSVGGQITKNVLRLGSNILLTRLLTEHDYGLSTLVNVVLVGLEMVSDLGIENSIIQHKRGDEKDFLDTAYTVQLLRGLALFCLGTAAAWPMAYLYDSPELIQLIPVASAGALLRGLWPTKLHQLRRHLEVKRLVSVDVAAQAIGVLVMAVHAYIYRSVWALIIGSVVIFGAPVVIGYFMRGHNNRLRWDKSAAHELVHFGKWIVLSSMVTFLADKFSIFASGKLVDKGTLGVYGISTMLGTLPMVFGGHAGNAVLLPALSASARADRAVLAKSFENARRVILPILLFITLGLMLLSPAFFFVAYKGGFRDAGWMVQLGMPGVWFFYLQDAWTKALLAIGRSRPLAVANGVKLVTTAVFSLSGYYLLDSWEGGPELAGFMGLIVGAGVGSFCGYAAVMLALSRESLPAWKLDTQYAFMAVVLSAIGVSIPMFLAQAWGMDEWRLISIPTSLLILVPTGAFTYKRVMSQVRQRG